MLRSLREINEDERHKMFIELQKSECYEKTKRNKFKFNKITGQ